jgi:Right handed beta helix region
MTKLEPVHHACRMKSLVLFTCALLLPAVAGATTWYVAPTGNDGNSCTQARSAARPKATIRAAFLCVGSAAGAGAGHMVQVASGTYTETVSNWPSGVTGNPFVLKSATQYGAIIRPGSTSSPILSFASGYVTVDGFVIDGVNVNANNIVLNPGTTEITIQNSEIKNTRVGDNTGDGSGSFQAIYAHETTRAKFLNNQIHDIAVGATAHFNHAIYWSGSNSIFEGNTIYNVGGNAVQIFTRMGNALVDNIVRNNTIYDYAKAGVGNGVYTAGSNTLVYNNVIYQTEDNPNAVGITLDGNGGKAYHNTIYRNGYIGLSVAGTASMVRNNITFQNGTDILPSGSQYVIDHNLAADPMFVSLGTFDFRLSANSPAIDAAASVSQISTDVYGRSRPQGSANDIGAFEFGDAVQPPPPSALHVQRP